MEEYMKDFMADTSWVVREDCLFFVDAEIYRGIRCYQMWGSAEIVFN